MFRFHLLWKDPYNEYRVSARRKPIGVVKYVERSESVTKSGYLPDGSYAEENWEWRCGWVAIYDGREVSGVKITRKEAAKYLAGAHGAAVQKQRQNLGDHAAKK